MTPARASRTPSLPSLTPKGSGGEPLDPLSRKLMQGVKLLSLLLLLVVANSFLNREEAPLEFNPVAAAAEHTQQMPGARFTMEAIYTSPALPRPMHAHGSGAMNSQTGRSRVVLQLDAPELGPFEMEAVGDGTSMYMRGSGISGELPGGKEWLEVQPFLGHSEGEAMVGGGDADSSLQMLQTVDGAVQRLGREKVRGVATQRYRTTVELEEYADLLRDEGKDELADQYEKVATLMPEPVTAEVWIDGKGIVRRSRSVMTLPAAPGEPTMTMDMRMDLFDFGARPAIALPDPSRVFDATPLVEESFDQIETD